MIFFSVNVMVSFMTARISRIGCRRTCVKKIRHDYHLLLIIVTYFHNPHPPAAQKSMAPGSTGTMLLI